MSLLNIGVKQERFGYIPILTSTIPKCKNMAALMMPNSLPALILKLAAKIRLFYWVTQETSNGRKKCEEIRFFCQEITTKELAFIPVFLMKFMKALCSFPLKFFFPMSQQKGQTGVLIFMVMFMLTLQMIIRILMSAQIVSTIRLSISING